MVSFPRFKRQSETSSLNESDSQGSGAAADEKFAADALFDAHVGVKTDLPFADGDAHVRVGETTNDGESFDQRPVSNRRIGTFSAVFIFATPASILGSAGSVGMALFMWVIGSLIAAAGALVYLEWATSLPRSGGERNYLDFFYRHPAHLVTACYAAYAALLGWPAGNSTYAGEVWLEAAGISIGRWNDRAIGVGIVVFALLLVRALPTIELHDFTSAQNGLAPRQALWLSNTLGIFKGVILALIVVSGWVALAGHVKAGVPEPSNFSNAFFGTTTNANSFVSALYEIIWAFIGYTNVFYVMSEVQHPIRTVKRAVPIALTLIVIIYMFVNIAFFAAVPKEVMLTSDRLVAVEFFARMFGEEGAKAVAVCIGLSAVGNSLVVLLAQGRVNQELGREGILPFSKFWASNLPLNAPFTGLLLQAIVTIVIILAPPAGDAYSFLLNLVSYPLNVVNVFVAAGLVVIYFRKDHFGWNPPVKASLPVTIFFLLAALFLVAAPFVPPVPGQEPYQNLWYALHCVVAWGVFALGAAWWILWAVISPRLGKYKLVREEVVGSDGLTRNVFHHRKRD